MKGDKKGNKLAMISISAEYAQGTKCPIVVHKFSKLQLYLFFKELQFLILLLNVLLIVIRAKSITQIEENDLTSFYFCCDLYSWDNL